MRGNEAGRRTGLLFCSYLVRLVLAAGILGYLLFRYATVHLWWDEGDILLHVVAQLDLYRALFYFLLPAGVVLLFIPISGKEHRSRSLLILLISFFAAMILGHLLPMTALRTARPHINLQNSYRLIGLYLWLNIFGLIHFHYFRRWNRRLKKLLLLAPGPADLLVPMWLWAAHRDGRSRWFEALRVIPSLCILALPFIYFVTAPGQDLEKSYHPALSPISEMRCYQVLVLPDDGSLIVTSDADAVYRIDAETGKVLSEAHLELRTIQSVGLDKGAGELVFADPVAGLELRLDADTLQVRQRRELSGGREIADFSNKWRTLFYEGTGFLATFSISGFHLLEADSGRVRYELSTGLADAAYDEKRDRIYLLEFSPGQFTAFSAQDMQQQRHLYLPEYPERLAIDRKADLLYITFPLMGRVLALDLAELEPRQWIEAFPGVRVAAVDDDNGLLILGGLSPVLEIRSCEDFSLIDRVKAPSWMRWATFDRDTNTIYFTSNLYGLWRLEMDKLDSDSMSGALRRLDPFYPVVNAISRRLVKILDLEVGVR